MPQRREVKNESQFFVKTAAEAKQFAQEWLKKTGYQIDTVPVGKWFALRLSRQLQSKCFSVVV